MEEIAVVEVMVERWTVLVAEAGREGTMLGAPDGRQSDNKHKQDGRATEGNACTLGTGTGRETHTFDCDSLALEKKCRPCRGKVDERAYVVKTIINRPYRVVVGTQALGVC